MISKLFTGSCIVRLPHPTVSQIYFSLGIMALFLRDYL